jgi:hypothetical protein
MTPNPQITSLELQLDILKKRNEKLEKVAEAARESLAVGNFTSWITRQHNLNLALQALDEVRRE